MDDSLERLAALKKIGDQAWAPRALERTKGEILAALSSGPLPYSGLKNRVTVVSCLAWALTALQGEGAVTVIRQKNKRARAYYALPARQLTIF